MCTHQTQFKLYRAARAIWFYKRPLSICPCCSKMQVFARSFFSFPFYDLRTGTPFFYCLPQSWLQTDFASRPEPSPPFVYVYIRKVVYSSNKPSHPLAPTRLPSHCLPSPFQNHAANAHRHTHIPSQHTVQIISIQIKLFEQINLKFTTNLIEKIWKS